MAARIKVLLGLTCAGLLVLALIPATAHTPSTPQKPPARTAEYVIFSSCNRSSFPEYIAFPHHGGYATKIQYPGDPCWWNTFSGQDADMAVGYQLVNGVWKAVATKHFTDSGRVVFNF